MLGKRLVALRNERGLTQEQLAIVFKMSRSTYAQYEVDRRKPDYDTLKMFSDYFGVSVDYLLGRTDDPRPVRNPKLSPDIRRIARAGEKMTPEQRERLLKVAEVLFPEAFRNEK